MDKFTRDNQYFGAVTAEMNALQIDADEETVEYANLPYYDEQPKPDLPPRNYRPNHDHYQETVEYANLPYYDKQTNPILPLKTHSSDGHHYRDIVQNENVPHFDEQPNPDLTRGNQFRRQTEECATTRTSMDDLLQWKWYWKDSDNVWKPFEPASLQQTIETKFLANQRIYLYSRENYKWNYSIDFIRMTQTNLQTGATKQLKRQGSRNVSCGDGLAMPEPPCRISSHVIDVERPLFWMPWDEAHPFELVLIPNEDPGVLQVSHNFYQTMSPDIHVLQTVYRVQNHTLWSAFCNQEKSMLNNKRRLGDLKPVDKRYLFHGTDSMNAARGICINNFDFRLCGKNDVVYGHGAYFARDARYSHNFTKPSPRLNRFMFMAQVLVGDFTTGKREYKRPPGKPGKDHELYDSCVDKVDDPNIFILFEKNAYYPEFLIRYHDIQDQNVPLQLNQHLSPRRPFPSRRAFPQSRSVHAPLTSRSRPSVLLSVQPRTQPTVYTTTTQFASRYSNADRRQGTRGNRQRTFMFQ